MTPNQAIICHGIQEPLPNITPFVDPDAVAEAFDTWCDEDGFSAAEPGDVVRVVMLRVWSAKCVHGIQARTCFEKRKSTEPSSFCIKSQSPNGRDFPFRPSAAKAVAAKPKIETPVSVFQLGLTSSQFCQGCGQSVDQSPNAKQKVP